MNSEEDEEKSDDESLEDLELESVDDLDVLTSKMPNFYTQ
jgi:hypothetical protein